MAQMRSIIFLASCLLVVVISMSNGVDAVVVKGKLKRNYYKKTCPKAEEIVFKAMQKLYKQDKTVAPGVLRIQFHDCMIHGCDASLLLDGVNAEKNSPINANLHGFNVFDAAKADLEKECPGVVSCADIVAFASRDSIVLTGGKGWNVYAGRKDGLISNINDPILNLPSSEMDVTLLLPFFTNKGMTARNMVDLSGAHTIGISHCFFIQGRLFAYPTTANHIDPTLPKAFLKTLQKTCPVNVTTPFKGGFNHAINMDAKTPGKFDDGYYQQLLKFRGLQTSDQSLYEDKRTKKYVIKNSKFSYFMKRFQKSMVVLTAVDVKIGSEGEIRKNCRVVNSK